MYCDVQGQMGLAVNCNETYDQQPQENDIQEDIDLIKPPIESEDEDDENVISLEKIKRDVIGSDDNGSETRSGILIYLCKQITVVFSFRLNTFFYNRF